MRDTTDDVERVRAGVDREAVTAPAHVPHMARAGR
jgi:hypothetical protein